MYDVSVSSANEGASLPVGFLTCLIIIASSDRLSGKSENLWMRYSIVIANIHFSYRFPWLWWNSLTPTLINKPHWQTFFSGPLQCLSVLSFNLFSLPGEQLKCHWQIFTKEHLCTQQNKFRLLFVSQNTKPMTDWVGFVVFVFSCITDIQMFIAHPASNTIM